MHTRRIVLALWWSIVALQMPSAGQVELSRRQAAQLDLAAQEQPRILRKAARYLSERPETVTAARSERSAGGLHDFFSEGDYWWPDPSNPGGPYIRRDGMTNPDNFTAHRHAMVRLAEIVATLASAYLLTGDERHAEGVRRHLDAWFVDPETRMTPHLLYAQAIFGRVTGRGTGIIDTIHLIEVVRGAMAVQHSPRLERTLPEVKRWFAEYLRWISTHPYGIEERDASNNHATCWVMQAAVFAQFVGDTQTLEFCRRRFKETLLLRQMAANGSFPLELQRTKPYGYSLFNLDAFATICQTLSSREDNLWAFALPDGRSMQRAVEFLYPYIADKSRWPFAKDVLYWDEWPARHPSLLFAGLALKNNDYLQLWSRLPADPTVEEVLRNLPVRHPLLWVTAEVAGRKRDEKAGAPNRIHIQQQERGRSTSR